MREHVGASHLEPGQRFLIVGVIGNKRTTYGQQWQLLSVRKTAPWVALTPKEPFCIMSTTIVRDDLFKGNKGFAEASTALLSRLVLEYDEIIANPETSATLRAYAKAVLAELRAELSSRARQKGRAA